MVEMFLTETSEHKANVFKILSVLFKQPNADIEYYLTHLKPSIEKTFPQLYNLAVQLEEQFKLHSKDLTDLQVEYAKLFVGPFYVLAPPYSSIYLHQGRIVYGESTLAALDMYNDAGINLSDEYKDLPDHISAELEFIYYLYVSYREKGDENYLYQIKSFVNKHLKKWTPLFAKKIVESEPSLFYNLLANLLEQVVILENSDLNSIEVK